MRNADPRLRGMRSGDPRLGGAQPDRCIRGMREVCGMGDIRGMGDLREDASKIFNRALSVGLSKNRRYVVNTPGRTAAQSPE
jgi:hypothetical protein